jgi:hypothetical protein
MTIEERSLAFEESQEITFSHKMTHNPKSRLTKKDMSRVNYLITRVENEEYASFNHFICFLEKDGFLYEMDSRRDGSVLRCKTSRETLLKDSIEVVRKYISMSVEPDIFSMMAFCKSPK